METVKRIVMNQFKARDLLHTPSGAITSYDLIEKTKRKRINQKALRCNNGSGRQPRKKGEAREAEKQPAPLPLPAPPHAAGAFEPYFVRFDHSLTTSHLNQREPAPLLKTRTPARTPTCLPPLGGSSRLRRRLC